MKNRFNFGYFISEGFRSIFSHGLMSFAAVCMIVACLLIMGSFSLVAINADKMLSQAEDENEFLAFIDETYTDAQIQQLQNQVLELDNVDSVTFVTKEEAKDTYLEGHEDDGLYANIPDDVFRDRYRIHVTDIERLGETEDAVKQITGVADTYAAREIAQGFVIVRNVASGVALVLIAILLVISLFIIANTIKLATFNRREEIAIMKMCGATNGFVRWPFVVEGLILGLTGAVLAFFFQWGIYQLVSQMIVQTDSLSLVVLIPFLSMAPRILAIFAGMGFVIGVGGSLVAIRKFLQV